MSHQPERKEKDCLNCGTTVLARYCHVCGQENILPHQNFWSLCRHFIYDLLHFDGKFYETLRHLLFKPGHVARQYVKGKRVSYLDPVRMYLFTSAFFFIIFFAVNQVQFNATIEGGDLRLSRTQRFAYASQLNQQLRNNGEDSILQRQLTLLLDTTILIDLKVDSSRNLTDTTFPVSYNNRSYLMVARRAAPAFDDPGISKGNWFKRKLAERWRHYRTKYGDDEQLFLTNLLEGFTHRLPYVLFLSLPFFALLLKLLYTRRKNFYYSDHAVFTLYHYIFSFILLLFYFLLAELKDWTGFGFLSFVAGLLLLSGGVHLFIAMKRFYGQGIVKTALKFVLLNLSGLVLISLLMLGLIIFSAFQI